MAGKRLSNLLAAAALLGSPALAHAARSVMVFVVADDKGAESATSKMSTLVEEAVARNSGYELVDLRDATGEVVSGETKAARKAADADLEAGKKAFAEGTLEPAEEKLRSAIKGYETAAAAMEKVDNYVDAYAYLAATLQLRGKEEDAKDELGQALAIKGSYKPDGKLNGGAFLDLLKQAKKESAEAHRGSASIYTIPAGGKVLVDGEFKGFAPVSVDRMPVGKHVFVFERPGYLNGGQVGEVTSTDDLVIKGHFTATHDFSEVEESLAQSAKEVASSAAGPNTWKVLSHFKIDRAVIGTIRTSGDNLVLDLSLVDAKAKRRISKRKNSFEGEEYGTLGREVSRLVTGLLTDADDTEKTGGKTKPVTRDPLDNVSGMEDWEDDGQPAPVGEEKPGAKKKKPAAEEDEAPKKRPKKTEED